MTTITMAADKIGLPSLAGWFKKVNAKRAYNAKVRQTIKELNQLSDYELRDIGIARGDIYSVATGDATLKRVCRENVAVINTNLKGWV